MSASPTATHGSDEEQPLAIALRRIAIFSDLEDDQLRWFASNADDIHFEAGDVLAEEGTPADFLYVLLEGEIQGRSSGTHPTIPYFVVRTGQVTGVLPFSRMVTFPLTTRGIVPGRVARFPKSRFGEMLQRIPQLLPRLMGVMADRIREVSNASQQREKLMALGKLSAGLAHELNNPAAAARRSAEALRQVTLELRRISVALNQQELSREQRSFLAQLEEESLQHLSAKAPLDQLEQSDLEDAINSWLSARDIPDSWKLAGTLAETGMSVASLEALGLRFRMPLLELVLNRLVNVTAAERLTGEIDTATTRISELVRAIKEYSYMDQMPEQEIDIHAGIESTLTILKFRLKAGVNVVRQFDHSMPRVCAHGSELNQVWTNLIDNAVDGMSGKGTLTIRTHRELDFAVVEISDDGAGIPEEVQSRIFEPFFTTKGVGQGTGLGLDAVYRIVLKHHGEVNFRSRPGETQFVVRLPFNQPKESSHESVSTS